jgi:hypothetical protein
VVPKSQPDGSRKERSNSYCRGPQIATAGITEVVLKKIIMDKTNWRKMLTNDIEVVDLVAELLCAIFYPAEVQEYFTMMLK